MAQAGGSHEGGGPGDGRGVPPVALSISTAGVEPAHRFDFWRGLFRNVDIQPLGAAARDFQAGLTALAVRPDFRLVGMESAPNLAAPRHVDDEVMLSLVEAGSAHMVGDEESATTADGRLRLVDGGRRPKVVSRGHRNVYLVMPRALAMQAVGGDRVMRRRAVAALPDSGLSRILAAQMRTIRAEAANLDPGAAAAAMHALQSLALSALRQMRALPDTGGTDPGLVAAARHAVARSSRRLSAEALAARLGCSRTRLFAAFQAEGLSLGDCIRDARMAQAQAVLSDPSRTVDEAAWISGYADASSFGKAFRRAFGMTPGEWRAGPADETARPGTGSGGRPSP